MEDSQEPGAAASQREEAAADLVAVILTPDQRVRVIISSTLKELAEERAAARRAIQRLHLVPVWYESGASPHPPRSMYRAYLKQSQVFVGIYWQRYGSVAPGMEISGPGSANCPPRVPGSPSRRPWPLPGTGAPPAPR